jgi:hypothetical protein
MKRMLLPLLLAAVSVLTLCHSAHAQSSSQKQRDYLQERLEYSDRRPPEGGTCPEPGKCYGYCLVNQHSDGNWYTLGDCISNVNNSCVSGYNVCTPGVNEGTHVWHNPFCGTNESLFASCRF